MWLRSAAFGDGSNIPGRFTCEGEDVSPPLNWGDVPAGTRSLALVCDDPDAPSATWHHWAAYDIPADWTGLTEGIRSDDKTIHQASNDSHRQGYSGPCPPRGHGPHRYHFRLLALSIENLPVPKHPSSQTVEREARKHMIAEATLVGLFERR